MSQEQVELEAGGSSRRRVLAGLGMAGAAAGATAILGACGTEPEDTFEVPGPDDVSTPGTGETPEPTGEATEPADEGEVQGLAATGDVEVGGGLLVEAEDLVITQPTEGEWRGFSATCTHQGCTISSIEGGTINCNCHGSQFSIEDGSVVTAAFDGDPAGQDPLPEVPLRVEDGQILRA